MKMERLMSYGLKFYLAVGLFVTLNATLATSVHARSIDGPEVIQAVAPVFSIPDKGNIAIGTVVIEVQIDSKGVVTQAKAVQGHPRLYPVCERAAKRWLFAVNSDSHVRTVRLTFRFRLMDVATPQEDLGPIFSLPYDVEIRSIGRI